MSIELRSVVDLQPAAGGLHVAADHRQCRSPQFVARHLSRYGKAGIAAIISFYLSSAPSFFHASFHVQLVAYIPNSCNEMSACAILVLCIYWEKVSYGINLPDVRPIELLIRL